MKADRRKFLTAALLFLLGFCLALGSARWWFSSAFAPNSDAPVASASDVDEFLEAVAKGDFAAIRETGEALFAPGTRVVDAARIFAPYAVNSLPPYSVYALYTHNNPDLTRRALLTLDGDGRVESFLAEEMAVIK